MGYGSRIWGIIDSKGKFKKCSYADFMNYCLEKRVSKVIGDAFDLSFDIKPACVGINIKNKYIAMWNVDDKEGTYKKFTF